MLPLPITFDDLYIYPLSSARLEKTNIDDTVGEKIYLKKCCNNIKSLTSGSYVKMYNGKIILDFEIIKSDFYYVTILGFNEGNYNPYNRIIINNQKYYCNFTEMTNHSIDDWREMPLSVYNNINNVYELSKSIYFEKGNNRIIIESEVNDNNEANYYDCIILSKNKYFNKNSKCYYPNNNGLYLAPFNTDFIDLDKRKFKDDLVVNINNHKYELKLDKSSYENNFIPLLYDFYIDDELIFSGFETNTKPSLAAIIQPDLGGKYLNNEFDIKFYMISERKSRHYKITSTSNIPIIRTNDKKIVDLGIKEHIKLCCNYEEYFIKMKDLFITEKIKIAKSLNII